MYYDVKFVIHTFTYANLLLIGIWIRDLRFACSLPQTQLHKIIKNLESKKKIKSVKSVAVSIIVVNCFVIFKFSLLAESTEADAESISAILYFH